MDITKYWSFDYLCFFVSDGSSGNQTVIVATLTQPYSYSHTITLVSPRVVVDPQETTLCMIVTVKSRDTLRVVVHSYSVSDYVAENSNQTEMLLIPRTDMAGYDRIPMNITDGLVEKSVVTVKIISEATSGNSQLSSVADIQVVPSKCRHAGMVPRVEKHLCYQAIQFGLTCCFEKNRSKFR